MHLVISRKSLVGLFGSIFATVTFLGKREDRLIAAAQKGDREAFESLQFLHAAAVRKFITRRVSTADKDDLVQDTWLAAWQSLHLFDDHGKFRSWLLTIAFRRVQDFHRREYIRPKLSIYAEAENAAYHQPEYAGIELKNAMRGFWESCTADQQELLTMYYSDGLNLPEISKITGRNLNTLKYQFYKIHNDAIKLLPSESEILSVREVTA